jgi:hypothetical protein
MSIYRGGIPLAPDVAKLLEHYKTPEERSLIPYADIAKIIGAAVNTNRFRSVVAAWRRVLDKPPHVRRLVAHSDKRAYMALDGDGHVRHADRKIDLGIRAVKRQTRSLAAVDSSRLSSEGKLQRDHALLKGGTVTQYHLRMSRRNEPEPPKAISA